MAMHMKTRYATFILYIAVHIMAQASAQTLVETVPDLAGNTTEGGVTAYKCKDNEYACSDQTCIQAKQICDGIEDCIDGSDENCDEGDYDYECTDGFACGDGVCLLDSQKCDGTDDCSDGSDEAGCPVVSSTTTSTTTTTATTMTPGCREDEFNCSAIECIPYMLRCNQAEDCSNGRDEEGCTEEEDYTDEGEYYYGDCDETDEFECSDGTCLPATLVCDGIPDCTDGDDEENCPSNAKTTASSSSCGNDKFECRNGQCIDRSGLCNGEPNCNDGSDETNCTVTMSTIVAKMLNYTSSTVEKSGGCMHQGEWYPPGDIVKEKCNGVMCSSDGQVREWSDPTCAACLSAKANSVILSLLALFVMLINGR